MGFRTPAVISGDTELCERDTDIRKMSGRKLGGMSGGLELGGGAVKCLKFEGSRKFF